MKARKVNANWAAVEAAGLQFGLSSDHDSVHCPLCDWNGCPSGAEQIFLPRADDSRSPEELDAELMSHRYARKGSCRDRAMGQIIENCPRLQAAIEAAIEAAALAAALAASAPEPAPAAPRKAGRL